MKVMRLQWAVIASFLVLGGSSSAEQYPVAVDLELVIAVDVSYSMDTEEQRVQRAGYVAAFLSPDIIRALRGGPLGKIAVTYIEWGGSAVQVVPWTVIDGAEFCGSLCRGVAPAADETDILHVDLKCAGVRERAYSIQQISSKSPCH